MKSSYASAWGTTRARSASLITNEKQLRFCLGNDEGPFGLTTTGNYEEQEYSLIFQESEPLRTPNAQVVTSAAL